jgi:hypothetical protein
VSPLKCLNCSLMTFANDLQTLEYPSRQPFILDKTVTTSCQLSFHSYYCPPPPPPSQSWVATHTAVTTTYKHHKAKQKEEEVWWQRWQQSHHHQRSHGTKYLVLTHVHWSPGRF